MVYFPCIHLWGQGFVKEVMPLNSNNKDKADHIKIHCDSSLKGLRWLQTANLKVEESSICNTPPALQNMNKFNQKDPNGLWNWTAARSTVKNSSAREKSSVFWFYEYLSTGQPLQDKSSLFYSGAFFSQILWISVLSSGSFWFTLTWFRFKTWSNSLILLI